jgi:hypothetical protein
MGDSLRDKFFGRFALKLPAAGNLPVFGLNLPPAGVGLLENEKRCGTVSIWYLTRWDLSKV